MGKNAQYKYLQIFEFNLTVWILISFVILTTLEMKTTSLYYSRSHYLVYHCDVLLLEASIFTCIIFICMIYITTKVLQNLLISCRRRVYAKPLKRQSFNGPEVTLCCPWKITFADRTMLCWFKGQPSGYIMNTNTSSGCRRLTFCKSLASCKKKTTSSDWLLQFSQVCK